jgi:hypothetical protein
MNEQDLNNLIPRHKFDIARAEQICNLGFPAVEPILPEILEWLQDGNWPVAHALHRFVISIGSPLAPYIRPILDGDDDTWKYFILTPVVRNSPELARALMDDLTRIAYSPTPGEDVEEVSELAREILAELSRT